jgi:hypothetical protein
MKKYRILHQMNQSPVWRCVRQLLRLLSKPVLNCGGVGAMGTPYKVSSFGPARHGR